MKNTFFTLALILIAAFTLNTSKAQKAMHKGMDDYIDPSVFVTYADDVITVPDQNRITVDAKENFKKQFPQISNARWHEAVDGGIIAHFDKDAIHTLVAYNKKGKWHHTINYYDASKLADKIYEAVKSNYPAYELLHVSEVHYDYEPVYMILLQGERTLKQIRFCDNEMEEISTYKRG